MTTDEDTKDRALIRILLPHDGPVIEIEAHWVRATCIAAAAVNAWSSGEPVEEDTVDQLIRDITQAEPGDPAKN